MQAIAKIIAFVLLGAACFLSVSCENMDTGAVSNALSTISGAVTNSSASSALSTASDVVGSTNQNSDQ